jgi:hypothetical protein
VIQLRGGARFAQQPGPLHRSLPVVGGLHSAWHLPRRRSRVMA